MVTNSVYMLCDREMAFSLFMGHAAQWWSHDRVRVYEPPRYLEVDLRPNSDETPRMVRVTFEEEIPGTRITLQDDAPQTRNTASLWQERLHALNQDLGAAS